MEILKGSGVYFAKIHAKNLTENNFLLSNIIQREGGWFATVSIASRKD